MFTSRLVTLAFVLVFAIVNVMAMPLPLQLRVGLVGASPRDLAPFTPIRAYAKRDGVWESDYGRRDPDVPEEDPSKTDQNLEVVAFRRDVPEEDPSKTDQNLEVVAFRRDVPEEDASKTDQNLKVVPFKRAPQSDNSFAVENAV